MNTAEKIVTLMRAGLPEDAVGVILGVDRQTISQASQNPSTAPTVSVAVGPKGDKGATGDKGDKGDRGDAGAPGVVPPGDKGPTGDKGLTGDKGATGDKGPTGDRGPQGLPGNQGANGQPGTKGATGDKGPTGDAGAGGGAGASWLYDAESSGVTSVSVPGLDGDTDIEYEIVVDGVIAAGGVARNVDLHPNGLATGLHFMYDFGGPGVGPSVGNGTGHLLLGYTGASDSRFLSRGVIAAKSGRSRAYVGEMHMAPVASAGDGNLGQFSGRWEDTAANLTSLDVDFGGGTFTGRVRVRKI